MLILQELGREELQDGLVDCDMHNCAVRDPEHSGSWHSCHMCRAEDLEVRQPGLRRA